jgi:hypothetical protein
MSVALRRIVFLVVLGAAVAAAVAWRRGRGSVPSAPPEWPPLPVAPPAAAASAWVSAARGEAMPDGYPVKVKTASGIYHVPGGRFYDRTMPDRWYATAHAAEADGYRRSKS